MWLNYQFFGQFPNGEAPSKTLNRQQCLMLFCGQTCISRGIFTECEKLPNQIAELG